MTYIIKGNLKSTNLAEMKTFLEYLNSTYPTELLPSGNAKALKTFFSFEVNDINTIISAIQDLIGKYPTIEISYTKKLV